MKTSYIRFGKRYPIPSTVQIRHEIRVLGEQCDRERIAALDGLARTSSWESIVAHRVAAANASRAAVV